MGRKLLNFPDYKMSKRARSSVFKRTLATVKRINDWDDWVSPSSISGAVLDDPILTYFEAREKRGSKRKLADSHREGMSISSDSIPVSPSSRFNDFIMQMGQQYEANLYERLCEQYPDDILEIADGTVLEKLHATLDALKSGIPMIYQPVVVDIENQTFGIPDLLVKSTYLKKLFPKTKLRNIYSNLGRFHYVVIDIKWSTIWFRTGKRTLRKHGRINAYKSQLYIYNRALGQMQGFTPDIAYVWGRAWKHQKKSVITRGSGDELLGEVHFEGSDSFVENKVHEALKWIRDVRKHSEEWSLIPPSRPELYPNMKNKFDGRWHREKAKLAKKLGEITQLWYCGLKARQQAWDKGITSYYSSSEIGSFPKLKASDMNIKGRRGEILDKIIEIQQPDLTVAVSPRYIGNNYMGWQDNSSLDSDTVQELYVDFETISSFMLNPDSPEEAKDRVFMVGIGYMGRRWQYRCFTAKSLDDVGEKKLFEEVYKYLKGWLGQDILLYHWGQAEQDWLDKMYDRYPEVFSININDYWVDFHKVVSEEPVVVRGATNFSLKNYTQALHDQGLISCVWASGDCCDGMNAMSMARSCYYNGRGATDRRMTRIRNYNEVDCRAVYEIVNYLRDNHTKPIFTNITMGDHNDEDTELDEPVSPDEEFDDEESNEWIPGLCCFCKQECNEASQACGRCGRTLLRFTDKI